MKKKINYNKLVRDKRIEKGLTQDDVANKMIVSRQTVSNWEKDGYNIHKDDLVKLSEYLDFKIPTKKGKYIILSLITLFFVMLFILLILNIKKNKIAIYKGNIDYQMTNTIFIETNSNYFLYLGSFINEDYDINIKLYYKSKNKNKILYEGNYSENLSFTEEKGYEEYFDKNFDINNLYIDITEKDITKTYKFNFIKENNQEKILEQVLSLCNGRLKKFGDYDFFENIQVLTPTKKGMLGTKELNKVLQKELNPSVVGKREKKSGEIIFREGDRVMQIKNNYDIFWDREILGVYENSTGVFNGEIGRIEKIDLSEKQLKVVFDDGKNVWYQFQELDQLELAYAITIHKSQGSEFDVVIIAVPQTAPMLLTRNLLYTAITRAKKLLIILGGKNTIDFMIQNVDSKKRNTGLKIKVEHLLNGDN